MNKSYFLDALRRVIPLRYRRFVPAWVRPALSYIFLAAANIAGLFSALLPRVISVELAARADMLHAQQALLRNDFAAAHEALNRCIENAPLMVGAHYLRGHVAAILNENHRAIDDLIFAINHGHDSADAHFYLALAHSNLGNSSDAIHNYEEALAREPAWTQAMVNLAHQELWEGNEDKATGLLRNAIVSDPAFGMPHHNQAARYDRVHFKPTDLDLLGKREFLLYDAYNLAGERAFHVGVGSTKGVELWGKGLRIQNEIRRGFSLPDELLNSLARHVKLDPSLPLRILPYEWVTQIGHIGMLDTYCKFQVLGWSARTNRIVLAPAKKIANAAFLNAWKKHFEIIHDEKLIASLFPYQRYLGDSFNAFLWPDGKVEGWQDVGARAHAAWDKCGSKPLLELSQGAKDRGRATLIKLGMPQYAWFVCLHVREGGYYRENAASTQGPRNAPIQDYMPAIQSIVGRGGWVIRMGDPSMTPLPKMPGVIDYAHSSARSDWMDVYLCGAARFFIGTTSGLTNAVISYGTPCVLVNCLTNYYQAWDSRVIFALKLLWHKRELRYLKFSEIVADPVRPLLFNLKALNEFGIVPHDNEPVDIVTATCEMLVELERGADASGRQESPVLIAWDKMLAGRAVFGSARPSIKFLERHAALL